MEYVILQPNSVTNHSGMYRVVKFADFQKVEDASLGLPFESEHDSYDSALERRDALNNS